MIELPKQSEKHMTHGWGLGLIGVLTLLASGLVGCASVSNPDALSSQRTQTPEAMTPQPMEPDPPSDLPPEAAPQSTGDPRLQVRECPGPVASEARAVVMAQLSEFTQGRFKRAYSYASDAFRSAIGLDEFREIIREDYPFLLDDARASFNGCVERDGKAYLQVAVTAEAVTVLTYRLVRDPDTLLAIDGASIVAVSLPPSV